MDLTSEHIQRAYSDDGVVIDGVVIDGVALLRSMILAAWPQ